MASGYNVSGRGDLDSLFKARSSAAGGVTGYQVAGVDLNQRYEPRAGSTAIAAVGYTTSGTDLAQLFMDINNLAAGVYLTTKTISEFSPFTGNVASYQVKNNGKLNYTTASGNIDQEAWCIPASNAGLYEVMATKISGTAEFIGTFGAWIDCNNVIDGTRQWYVSSPGVSTGVMDVTIRRKSDSVTMATARITLRCL